MGEMVEKRGRDIERRGRENTETCPPCHICVEKKDSIKAMTMKNKLYLMFVWRNISVCSECKGISGWKGDLVIKNKRGYKAKKHQKGNLVGSVFFQGAAEIIDKLFLGESWSLLCLFLL